ncbi:MAG TPA: protein kinase [Sphingomicrobium sp.]|jgi:serine/threonine protein kinase|nr:protein kinase [Sphingomicrobium sp.]
MNKAYSNKALPMGTVLREWRIEEVLGVGGFGIVYKAQGIYFNELVAIKEYFPSSISERDSSDTVVPIDSDAEEVHALGLKKFVEEAKLLWNLSTPTRHPNIVSVRSLFEIHGTAYMVMDFEDGLSLSKMIKQGRRFNERSLWSILRPIAEGLERAHRVGVLHRDIKPPNILINEDNRPVLIDFGSARFDTAEATSTKVTFHTPPYAAIEQYVKTYAQGPWTDIYALGVVMYECVTGEKPPEVLERLHAGLGKPLAGGKWPGYSKRFLAAVDAAMIVKPEERPQSITDWLAMFGKKAGQTTDETDEDATRFYAQQVEAEEIVPVPPTPNADSKGAVETGVPADPKQARFKRAGEETGAGKKTAPEPVAAKADEPPPNRASKNEDAEAASPPAKTGGKPADATPRMKMPSRPAMAGAAVAVLAIVGVGGYMLSSGSGRDAGGTEAIGTAPDNNAATVASLDAVQSELGDGNVANTADAGAQPEAGQPDDQAAAIEALRAEKAKNAAAEAKLAAIKKAAAKSSAAQAGTSTAASRTADRHSGAAEASTNSAGSEGAGVSQAKLSQFYSVVDDARSMAKKVMRSKNSQNAALAKSYDANLKTLRDSIRGVSSDREADRLIKQANQTRAYVKFLVTQQ